MESFVEGNLVNIIFNEILNKTKDPQTYRKMKFMEVRDKKFIKSL